MNTNGDQVDWWKLASINWWEWFFSCHYIVLYSGIKRLLGNKNNMIFYCMFARIVIWSGLNCMVLVCLSECFPSVRPIWLHLSPILVYHLNFFAQIPSSSFYSISFIILTKYWSVWLPQVCPTRIAKFATSLYIKEIWYYAWCFCSFYNFCWTCCLLDCLWLSRPSWPDYRPFSSWVSMTPRAYCRWMNTLGWWVQELKFSFSV